MIPKIIHYCWLSNDPIPEDLQKYMKTWKKNSPTTNSCYGTSTDLI